MPQAGLSRRHLLASLPALLVALRPGVAQAALRHALAPGGHPEPRPGVTAARMLTRAQLKEHPDAIPFFDMVRRIPQIADGIRCHCGCAELPSFRSLLSCYEPGGMAPECDICQGQGKLAYTLHERGKTLQQIRDAIDAAY